MANLSPDEIGFHQASESGSVTDLQNIIKKITNSRDDEERTPLHKAVQKGDTEMVKFLIDNGADVNAQDVNGLTPLYVTAYAVNGNITIAKMLIEKEAIVHAKTKIGCTPLYAASVSGHLEIVKCLIENGANVNTMTKRACTPLTIASQKGHLEVVKCLIQNGAEINLRGIDGHTSLHFAAGYGHLEIVQHLIENGAVIDEKNANGHTPLFLATNYEKHDVANYLIEIKNMRAEDEIPKENYSNKDPCIICTAPKNGLYVLLPCGHASLCEACCIRIRYGNPKNCPSCKTPINSYQKIFI